MSLLQNIFMKILLGAACMSLLLFLAAGTYHYPGAWILLGIMFLPMPVFGVVLPTNMPALPDIRLIGQEDEEQDKDVIFVRLLFPAVFVIAALDFRYGWSHLPFAFQIGGAVVYLAGYILYARLTQENARNARLFEIRGETGIIESGLYAYVRNPVHFTMLLISLAMPVVLGSAWAYLLLMIGYLPVTIRRIRALEEDLTSALPDYDAYARKVKYRLVPFIW